jgi:hypothetical protein
MIKYSLVCDKAHAFESWFPDSDSYDAQARRGLVACPECGSIHVQKAMMAPAVAGRASTPEATGEVALLDERHAKLREVARAVRRQIIANTEDVGRKFPEEARAMHEGEMPTRSIRGEATPEEARSLLEDGVGVLPLPALPD